MSEESEQPGADADRVIERNETYEHDQYGTVEVMGIWKGVEEVDSTGDVNEKDVFIVRYSTETDGEQVDELTDTLDEFLEATDG